MPQAFDSSVVRAWIALALEAVGEGREEIDAINVFPVADGDTGTNLQRTLEAAGQALEAEWDAGSPHSAAPALRALARGALLGACGNSGTILAQLLRGMAGACEAAGTGGAGLPGGGRLLADALARAAESAYEAVAHPVEGTMLSVARAAADAAGRVCGGDAAGDDDHVDAATVARAAHERSREALAETTGQLDVLRRAGVVDAGGRGLVAVLGALADALGEAAGHAAGARPRPEPRPAGTDRTGSRGEEPGGFGGAHGEGGGAYEVMYLLDADDTAVAALRERLDGLGDSLVVGGGDGLWSIHVHADDAGAAVEAGLGAGRPHRIRITYLSPGEPGGPCAPEGDGGAERGDPARGGASERDGAAERHGAADPGGAPTAERAPDPEPVPGPVREPASVPDPVPGPAQEPVPATTVNAATVNATTVNAAATAAEPGRTGRAVVAVVPGAGLAALCEDAGALVVRAEEAPAGPDEEALGTLGAAVLAGGAAEVVLMPNDAGLHAAASRAAEAARAYAPGLRAAVVPTRAAVQGVAALAVHDPERPFDDDVAAMTSAAGATRYGHVAVASAVPGPPPRPDCAGEEFGVRGGEQGGDLGGDLGGEPGGVRGVVADEVVVTGRDVAEVAAGVLERMLASGGELVTLIAGAHAPRGLAEHLAEQVRGGRPGVDAVAYSGGQDSPALLIGVE